MFQNSCNSLLKSKNHGFPGRSDKGDKVSVYVGTSDVQMTWLRFLFHDHDWKLLESRSSTNKIEMKAPNWGWLGCTSGDELNWTEQIGLHVTVEVEYEAHVASTPPLKGRLSEDFLLKFDDEDDKDVTFLVKKEKIKAHKVILSARCPYLKAMFKSGMEESVTNEVEVPDIAPEVFKEMLKFLYCDVAPEYHEDISAGLLVAAERYGLEELKKRCESALTSHLDAKNVVEFLLLADDHNCPTLLEKASLVLRSHLQSIATERMKKLERNPALLRKLLMLGY